MVEEEVGRFINDLKDIKQVGDIIIGNLIEGKVTSFYLIVKEPSGFGYCSFTPFANTQNEKFMCVDDYKKVMMLLLSHPCVKQLSFDPKNNVVNAFFDNPYCEEWEELETKEFYSE